MPHPRTELGPEKKAPPAQHRPLQDLRVEHEQATLEAGRAQLDIQIHERKAKEAHERYGEAKGKRDNLAAQIAQHPEAR